MQPDPTLIARCFRAGTLCSEDLASLATAKHAERFQEQAVAASGYTQCGYKIGATNTASQLFLGSSGPLFGPVFSERLFDSGAELCAPAGLLGIECEFGFRLGRDFPAEGERVSPEALQEAVRECFPAIAIAGRRVGPTVPITEASAIADLCLSVAVVRGPEIPDWRSANLASVPVVAALDGTVAARGNGAAVMGHPLNALFWLATALLERGRTLRCGDVVVTGSCTGITPVGSGQLAEARFGSLPPVHLHVV